MSSIYNIDKNSATFAIDGTYELQEWDHNLGAHTANELEPWIQISLGEDRSIGGVKIWNRCENDCE